MEKIDKHIKVQFFFMIHMFNLDHFYYNYSYRI
jgi:hypothetical protein